MPLEKAAGVTLGQHGPMYACGDLIACRSERGEGWRCTVVRSLLLAQCILLGKRECWKCYNQPEQNTLRPVEHVVLTMRWDQGKTRLRN